MSEAPASDAALAAPQNSSFCPTSPSQSHILSVLEVGAAGSVGRVAGDGDCQALLAAP